MRNYSRFHDKIDVSRAISIIKDLTCVVRNSSNLMKNDMLDFKVIKFFSSNTCTGKVLHPLPVIWEFPSLEWVKNNIDGAARGYPDLASYGGLFHWRMGEFIGVFFAFLEVHTVMVAEFYGDIHVTNEAQKMGLTNV